MYLRALVNKVKPVFRSNLKCLGIFVVDSCVIIHVNQPPQTDSRRSAQVTCSGTTVAQEHLCCQQAAPSDEHGAKSNAGSAERWKADDAVNSLTLIS